MGFVCGTFSSLNGRLRVGGLAGGPADGFLSRPVIESTVWPHEAALLHTTQWMEWGGAGGYASPFLIHQTRPDGHSADELSGLQMIHLACR